MGGVNSYCIGRCTKTEECPENHSRIPKRIRGHKRNLSSTFSQLAAWDTQKNKSQIPELLNINLAGEEELMTLPGINRNTARNIVQYRKEIGGRFRRIEDLVLVTGIGGDKFEILKQEITVGSRHHDQSNGHGGSHGGSGGEDRASGLGGGGDSRRGRHRHHCCINTANMFQLMELSGVNQKLAEHIVSYRERHGPFKRVDDLLKVKGIDQCLLGALQHKLVLEPNSSASSSGSLSRKSSAGSPPPPTMHPIPPLSTLSGSPAPSSADDSAVVFTADGPAVAGHQRSASQHIRAPDTLSQLSRLSEMFSPSQLDLITQLRPLSQRVVRPKPTDPLDPLGLTFLRDDREVLRIASWNLERLNADKIGNPGVREVVCLTLWENGISLLAIQEVSEPEALEQLCAELNHPSLPNTRRWAGHRGQWAYQVSLPTGRMYQGKEYQALVWDTSRGIRLKRHGLLEAPHEVAGGGQRAFTRSPFLGHFTVGEKWEVLIVGVHLKAAGLTAGDEASARRTKAEAECLTLIAQAIEETGTADGIDVLVLGDFNLSPDAESFDSFRDRGFNNLIGSEQSTNIGGNRCLDNVWHRPAGCTGSDDPDSSDDDAGAWRSFSGHCGVVRRGLEHPFIPGGRARGNWGWNGVPSDHCPVWSEFFIEPEV